MDIIAFLMFKEQGLNQKQHRLDSSTVVTGGRNIVWTFNTISKGSTKEVKDAPVSTKHTLLSPVTAHLLKKVKTIGRSL
nr:hypothetical protein HmN_000975000 [Hymenolepis microstoma]